MICDVIDLLRMFIIMITLMFVTSETTFGCRYRSNHIRQDGGLCFELAPWQHQPVELEEHLRKLKLRWGNTTVEPIRRSQLALVNSEISRYMDTVIAPFLDTYHRNIQVSYQRMTEKILKRIKDEISAAVVKKNKIYSELTLLADQLKLPAMCDEDRRRIKTLASQHIAKIYSCTEDARQSIAKMGVYAQEMIDITKKHMEASLAEATKFIDSVNKRAILRKDINTCLRELSKEAILLGYELDLSLTNARRHNEQSCEKISSCSSTGRKTTDENVALLKEELYQCVYA